MHIANINQIQLNKHCELKRSNNIYSQNGNNTSSSVSFGNLKYKINTIASTLGIILGIILFVSKCGDRTSSSQLTEHTDEYYRQVRTQHHIEIYQNGDPEYVPTKTQLEQTDRMNNRMDSLVKKFPSGTPERENIERIYNNELDKISASDSERGRDMTHNEEGQAVMDLRDSINTLYPDRKVDIVI